MGNWLTQAYLKKRPLNGCSSSSSISLGRGIDIGSGIREQCSSHQDEAISLVSVFLSVL